MSVEAALPVTTLVRGLLFLAEGLAEKLTLDDRLNHVCRAVVSILGCDRSSIFLRDDGYYRGRYNYGNPPDIATSFPRHKVSLTDLLISRAVRSGKPVIVNDALRSKLMHGNVAETARIRAIVVAPFFDADGEADGFITAEYNESLGVFSELDSTLLLGAARLAQGSRQIEAAQADKASALQTAQALSGSVRRLEQLEAIGRVAGGVAHDLNNVLTIVLGNTELLKLSDQLAEEDRQRAEDAHVAAQRAASVIDELLAFGRRQPTEAGATDLESVILGQRRLLERILPANQTLELQLDPSLPPALADPVQVERALMNLVLNAREAMRRGGAISITLDRSPHDEEFALQQFGKLEGPMLRLRVADQGRGVREEDRERIFEPFYSTKSTSSNSGLGLSTVFGIMRQAGGYVLLDSPTDRGAAFSLYFPQATTPKKAPQERLATLSSPATRQFRFLIAEDESALGNLLRLLVEAQGHQVVVVGSATEVLEAVADDSETADLLITDLMMPDYDGVELAQRIEELLPRIRVLFISGHSVDPDAVRQKLDARHRFLAKPFEPADLLLAIEELAATAASVL